MSMPPMNSMMLAQLMKDLQVGFLHKDFDRDISDEETQLIESN